MATPNDAAQNPSSERSWQQDVIEAWGDEWNEPEVEYEFSNRREFYEGKDT